MRYAALLRGINVGGNKMIKMVTLRATFVSLGFENVKTYINSGNLAFDTAETDDGKLANRIHDAIQSEFGFDISVMVRSIAEIGQIIDRNPFIGQFENDKDVHVFFLNEDLTAAQRALMLGQSTENEIYAVFDRHVISMLKISILDSAVGKGFIDKKLKVGATARNWRTVQKLAEL
jgi:uncharacterized protein (DUF1697 family)